MTLDICLTSRPRLFRYIVCLCALFILPSHVALQGRAETTEEERPCQKEGEGTDTKQVVSNSGHRRLKHRRHGNVIRPIQIRDKLQRINSHAGRQSAIVGHQLGNGLRPPLLI